jgi:hypothetical protein
MSKQTESVHGVFDVTQTTSGTVFTQTEVGRVGRRLEANEFPGANGSEANVVPSDQKTPQPQAHSDHSDQFPTKDGPARLSAEKAAVSTFGDTHSLVREIWAMPGERAFQLDGRTRARTCLSDACPAGIDPIRWRQAIEAAGTLMAKVDGGAGPVITFREVGDRAIPEKGDQALSSELAASQNTRAPDAVEGT